MVEQESVSPAPQPAKAIVGYLVCVDDSYLGQRIPIFEGTTRIGRAPDGEVCIPDHTLSRRHCRIEARLPSRTPPGESPVTVVDLESRGGICVNGVRIDRKGPLRPGDEILLGGTLWRLDQSVGASVPLNLEAETANLETATGVGARLVSSGGPNDGRVVEGDSMNGNDLRAAEKAFIRRHVPEGPLSPHSLLFGPRETWRFVPSPEQLEACLEDYTALLERAAAIDLDAVRGIMEASELALAFLHRAPSPLPEKPRLIALIRQTLRGAVGLEGADGFKRLDSIACVLERSNSKQIATLNRAALEAGS